MRAGRILSGQRPRRVRLADTVPRPVSTRALVSLVVGALLLAAGVAQACARWGS